MCLVTPRKKVKRLCTFSERKDAKSLFIKMSITGCGETCLPVFGGRYRGIADLSLAWTIGKPDSKTKKLVKFVKH